MLLGFLSVTGECVGEGVVGSHWVRHGVVVRLCCCWWISQLDLGHRQTNWEGVVLGGRRFPMNLIMGWRWKRERVACMAAVRCMYRLERSKAANSGMTKLAKGFIKGGQAGRIQPVGRYMEES